MDKTNQCQEVITTLLYLQNCYNVHEILAISASDQ